MAAEDLDLLSDVAARVERFPKPRSAAMALQPLFEAVSNAIQSTQDKYKDKVSAEGEISVSVSASKSKTKFSAQVEDNGYGLNNKNFLAFRTTDTLNKIEIGGKGVGRLLWLAAFPQIKIESWHKSKSGIKHREFDFVLGDKAIKRHELSPAEGDDTGVRITFSGLRDNGYAQKFPKRNAILVQHFASHFLPTLFGEKCPDITIDLGKETYEFPSYLEGLIHRSIKAKALSSIKFGDLRLDLIEGDKTLSSDLKGSNFIHFVAHDRTVLSQPIDGKLGLKAFGDDKDRVFHGILRGSYLDENVNQERTAFVFPDSEIDEIVSDVCFAEIESFLKEPLLLHRQEQRKVLDSVAQTYPSVAFGSPDELQDFVPSGELAADALYGHLARERFRRDYRQAEKIRSVLKKLKSGKVDAKDFYTKVKEASDAIEDAERRSLADYVVRRKVVLEFLEILVERVRQEKADSSFQREDILHSFICPLRTSTVGSKIDAATSHELWVLDERLTFAKYFSSDVEFSKLSDDLESDERADLVMFDYAHALRESPESSRVLLIEFKRPGRKIYKDSENPIYQVENYVKRLKSGNLEDFKGRKIDIDDRTIFYCYVVGDIVGKLDEWTHWWQRTLDGRGRFIQPGNGFNGSIEVIGWDALIKDANERNQSFFDKMGISGRSFFLPNGN
ncbi:MAG: ATP-binding protein [Sphingomonadaceae bacterium]